MRIIKCKIGQKLNLGNNLAATIGNFDGVHKGHQSLINKCKEVGEKSVVITFNPHPSCILKTNFKYYFLTSLTRKIDLIKEINPNYLLIVEFSRNAALTSKEYFINWLKSMNIKTIVCGSDYHFGYKNSGSIADLEKEFNLIVMDNLVYNNERISSSNVKRLLEEGKVNIAKELLGRYYSISGLVVEGYHNGEKLGYRTANLDILGNVPPKSGVYAVYVTYNKKKYLGMCNIGYNPTIGKLKELKMETHIFDFNKIIYGEEINIEFIQYIREETKFTSLDELKNALESDLKYIKNNFK